MTSENKIKYASASASLLIFGVGAATVQMFPQYAKQITRGTVLLGIAGLIAVKISSDS